MSGWLQSVVSVIILCPILLWFLIFHFYRKRTQKKAKAIGVAADWTTFILFFSVPLAVQALWSIQITIYVIVCALIIAIIMTIIEWKTSKEMELVPVLRKIWRVLFLLLSVLYFLVWIIGISQRIYQFLSGT